MRDSGGTGTGFDDSGGQLLRVVEEGTSGLDPEGSALIPVDAKSWARSRFEGEEPKGEYDVVPVGGVATDSGPGEDVEGMAPKERLAPANEPFGAWGGPLEAGAFWFSPF